MGQENTGWTTIWANDGLTCYAKRYHNGAVEENHPENGYAFSDYEKDCMAVESSEYQLCYQDIAVTFNA